EDEYYLIDSHFSPINDNIYCNYWQSMDDNCITLKKEYNSLYDIVVEGQYYAYNVIRPWNAEDKHITDYEEYIVQEADDNKFIVLNASREPILRIKAFDLEYNPVGWFVVYDDKEQSSFIIIRSME
ncbi:MAG: hypothetical protein IKE29_07990, partial [Paenibacillus sp.]|uniref:hypothetical protein n=1 Tax=Paenibacillus sp. TaxID=58172 RepID=UPI0025F074CB